MSCEPVRDENFYRGLPRVRYGATALIRNVANELLLVRAVGGTQWSLPGGHAADDELPPGCCERKIRHELGLTLPVGPLLVVHWMLARPPKPEGLQFAFDCGHITTAAAKEKIRLPEGELEQWCFANQQIALQLLDPMLGRRVAKAYTIWRARSEGRLVGFGELWDR